MNTFHVHAGAAAVVATLAFAATAAAPAVAAAPRSSRPAFALSPVGKTGALLLRGTPGRVLRGAVLVRSLSQHTVTVKLQRADIRSASNGNADYRTMRPSQTGRWLQLDATTVRLAPNASRRVAFTVRIPATARHASNYAGIVAVNAAEIAAAARTAPGGKAFSFNRINRQALPITVRLPGPLSRNLALRSLTITVEPVGAGLVLGLLPGGSELIAGASVRLKVTRGSRTILTNASTLGQLFPGAGLRYRIAWAGRPTKGSYRVVGVIRPKRAAPIYIDQTIGFSPAQATQFDRETTHAPPLPGIPMWVWVALALSGTGLIALLFVVFKQRRRPTEAVA